MCSNKKPAKKFTKNNRLLFLSIAVFLIATVFLLGSCTKKDQDLNALLGEIKATPVSFYPKKLTVPDITGSGSVSPSDYKGSVTLVSVWKSGCKFCNYEAPLMKELADLVANDPNINIVGISVDQNKNEARAFVDTYQLPYANGLDPKGERTTAAGYEVSGTPTTFILDTGGQVIGTIRGYHEFKPEIKYKTLKAIYEKVSTQ